MDAKLFGPNGEDLPTENGYRGIWYYNQPSGDEYVFKYSGGLGTYPQPHVTIAVHAPEAQKTFFCYGGTQAGRNELLHMISYFDHTTGEVARPRALMNKKTDDAHDNPTMMIDSDGYVWMFSNSHGLARYSYIHKSVRPYEIDRFRLIQTTNFSYSQPWYMIGEGFLVLHTRYSDDGHRRLFSMTSQDGTHWSEPQMLAYIDKGHYQISWRDGARVGTALNYHPEPVGLNARTNLYYVESGDFGATWRTAGGEVVTTPLIAPDNPALVYDYASDGLLVYLKDIAFDAGGHPVILHITSRGYASGPANDPRTWMTARWTGSEWETRSVTTSDNNYDHGMLTIEEDGWRIIGPTETGPQPYNPGGEVAIWESVDGGENWSMTRKVTASSPYNHTFVRHPVDAHYDFYALWADGHARRQSDSRLYFADKNGNAWRLPTEMRGPLAVPEPLDL